MNRTYLTRAIRELAGVYGYTIHTDTDDRTPREIVLLPAAWLPPIRLKEVEGRLHGRATYRTAAAAPRGKALVRTAQRGVEPNGTATLRSLHPVKHRPEGHSRRKPHRPTRIGSLHPARRNLPNGQSRRHHLFLGTRTPRTAAIGLSDAASASFEKKRRARLRPQPRHRRPHGISDRTQSSTSKPVFT